MENKWKIYCLHLFQICWLPLALIFVFVLQNHLFNGWLAITVRPYFIRRTIVTASFGLLLFGPAILLKKWIKYLYLILISSVVAIVFITQFIFYSYSGGFLQTSVLFYAGQGMTLLATAKTLLTYRLIFFIIGPLIVATAWIFNCYHKIIEKTLIKKEKIIAGTLIVIFTIAGYAYLFTREHMEAGNTEHIYQYNKLFDVNALVKKVGVINFSLGDAINFGLQTDEATAADAYLIKNFQEQQTTTTLGINYGLLKNRNLILIQIESLENAVINQKINGQEITPNLNKLANEGLYFSNYYAPIGPGTTVDTEFMILNSLYALPDKVAFIQYAYNHYTALPDLLKKNGYHAYALHGDVSSFWNRANMYPQLGYEKLFDRYDYTIPRNIGVYDLGDKDFFEQSILKLKSLPQPFMATLITLTSHTPYELPTDLITINIPPTTTLNWLQQNYAQSIHYTDQAIGGFISQLKTVGLYDNSLILVYGDHSSYSKISNGLGTKNGIFADLQSTQVPMIILAPSTSLKGNKNTPASHLDIYPTVANLLGVQTPPDIFGHDMIEGKNTVAVSRNLVSGTITSIITDKLAFHISGDGEFKNGICVEMQTKKRLDIETCHELYNKEDNAVRVSDLMVKGNLIKTH